MPAPPPIPGSPFNLEEVPDKAEIEQRHVLCGLLILMALAGLMIVVVTLVAGGLIEPG